jgi:DNA-binding response OmpR family regulator
LPHFMQNIPRPRILVVEDDQKIAASIKLYLEHAGFDAMTTGDGRRSIELARERATSLIILDLMLPGMGGFEVCRELRRASRVPIIMLTARSAEQDKLRGLDLGADDYITKPFSLRELVARVRAVLRRASGEASTAQIRLDGLMIDLEKREVEVKGKPISLTPTEFKLLETLATSPGRVFTRQQLMEAALGWDSEALDRTVDAHIMNLRKKIGTARNRPSFITTVFGVGYKFREGDDAA